MPTTKPAKKFKLKTYRWEGQKLVYIRRVFSFNIHRLNRIANRINAAGGFHAEVENV